MAMHLRLTDTESDALRAKAEQEGRSMQEVARTAISQYVTDRPQRLLNAIDRVRTEEASRLLKGTELSATEIGYICGFADAAHFTRRFKQRYGCPPSRFRAATPA